MEFWLTEKNEKLLLAALDILEVCTYVCINITLYILLEEKTRVIVIYLYWA